MSKSMLTVRIPESMHKYIKIKSIEDGIQQQELITRIIASYQQQDTEFLARFPQFQQSNEEINHV